MPNKDEIVQALYNLKNSFSGDIYFDPAHLLMYATDASVYRELPIAVTRPRNVEDIKLLISFAAENHTSLIPRAAGTSLAGQVVGGGIVVDISRYFTKVLELNVEEHWVRVQPGVVLDELNFLLKPHGLFFGPETSTSNRCMIAGMLGNNSCGAHSLVYGSTRDHTLEIKAILSDGSEAEFKSLSPLEFEEKLKEDNLESEIYRQIHALLSDKQNQDEIRAQYPHPLIKRRNTGYALDLLLETETFTPSAAPFNLCRLLAGSEGTLAFTTEIKLNLVPLPPPETALVCVHVNTVNEALKGNLIALNHKPVAVELMDKIIMDCTLENIEQRKNRFFIQGDPGAILIVEFAEQSRQEILDKAAGLEKDLRDAGIGFHFPVLFGSDIKKVWNLRKAGLGLLSNVPGDAKPVAVIEDTAVLAKDLPAYIEEFQQVLKSQSLDCVYYAHIATGELHLRPVLDLKKQEDVERFRMIAVEIARLVKKYKGSLSGEHGDGRLRGEFIPFMLGDKVYSMLLELKNTWDPLGVFNPGKITNTPRMNSSLRYKPGQQTSDVKTIFSFGRENGILRAAEQCNGSGDCRKSEIIGGTMCPSFMASKDENKTTRARANILREFLTNSTKSNPFNHKELYDVMDLCLSCKGCKSECPSNVDIAKYKAEFLQHYYDANGIPLRTRLIAYISTINRLGILMPGVFNFFNANRFFGGLIKKLLGFAPKRRVPALYKMTLKRWLKNNPIIADAFLPKRKVWLFCDEFTNYNDVEIGIKAIRLLRSLNYDVQIPLHKVSGRTFLSKGLIRKAQTIANRNIELLADKVGTDTPMIGIEPSGILSFRDEYPELCAPELREKAEKLARNTFMIEEFIASEFNAGNINRGLFKSDDKSILLHGHCYQKSLAGTAAVCSMLQIPENYHVEEIKSGCCGMAGSFGYEKEHYELSMKVGELVLFPAIRHASDGTIIAASGTSCRHQIADGTGKSALHPVEILWDALITK